MATHLDGLEVLLRRRVLRTHQAPTTARGHSPAHAPALTPIRARPRFDGEGPTRRDRAKRLKCGLGRRNVHGMTPQRSPSIRRGSGRRALRCRRCGRGLCRRRALSAHPPTPHARSADHNFLLSKPRCDSEDGRDFLPSSSRGGGRECEFVGRFCRASASCRRRVRREASTDSEMHNCRAHHFVRIQTKNNSVDCLKHANDRDWTT
jgi:hypothetical protein